MPVKIFLNGKKKDQNYYCIIKLLVLLKIRNLKLMLILCGGIRYYRIKLIFTYIYKIVKFLLFYEKFYSNTVFVFILSITVFGQINEQNQEGLLDSIENPEIMSLLDLDSISLSKSSEMRGGLLGNN
jgi:hypothetical protein